MADEKDTFQGRDHWRLTSVSGKVWRLPIADSSGTPVTESEARGIAQSLGFELVIEQREESPGEQGILDLR